MNVKTLSNGGGGPGGKGYRVIGARAAALADTTLHPVGAQCTHARHPVTTS